MLHLIIYASVLFIACYFQAITGFGQGLIIAPLMLILFSKYTALSALMIVGLGLNAFLSLKVRAKGDKNLILTLLIGCLFGLPLGVLVIKNISLDSLQLIVGLLSIAIVFILIFLKIGLSRSKYYELFAGFLSGSMQTSMGLAGPPVIILLTAQKTPKQIMRKSLPVYFLLVGTIGAIIYLFSGVFNANGVLLGAVSLPIVILAGYVGNLHGHKINEKYYKNMVVAGVLLTGILAIYQGLSSK